MVWLEYKLREWLPAIDMPHEYKVQMDLRIERVPTIYSKAGNLNFIVSKRQERKLFSWFHTLFILLIFSSSGEPRWCLLNEIKETRDKSWHLTCEHWKDLTSGPRMWIHGFQGRSCGEDRGDGVKDNKILVWRRKLRKSIIQHNIYI